MSATTTDNLNPIRELVTLRDELLATAAKRIAAASQTVSTPEEVLDATASLVDEIRTAIEGVRAERAAALKEYDAQIDALDRRARSVEGELAAQRKAIAEAVRDAQAEPPDTEPNPKDDTRPAPGPKRAVKKKGGGTTPK